MAILKELRQTRNPHARAVHRNDKPILEVDNLSVRYESGLALDQVGFQLHHGERVALVGPNGAGKSTLFKVIAGILEPGSGQVSIAGEGPGGHICIAYVPQRSQVDWSFPVSVKDVVMMGRTGKLGLFHWPKRKDRELVRQALIDVGMEALAERQISELSGGQQQRMFLARALAQEAELMLMDEPLNGLDVQSQEVIFAILDELRRRNVTIMVATHDLDQAADRFDRVLLLNRRLIGFGTPQEVFTAERLLTAYGGHLKLLEGDGQLVALGDTCCDEGEEVAP